MRVNTSQGFELCPADACAAEDEFCPTGDSDSAMFRVLEGFEHPILAHHERFLVRNGIEIAGIELITDADGEPYTYDINTHTNCNSAAEAVAERYAMDAVARFLGQELGKLATSACDRPGG